MYNKNAWESFKSHKPIMDFAKGYMEVLDKGRTERIFVQETVKILEKNGFTCICKATSLKPGDKVFAVNKNKNVAAFVIGKKPLCEGMHILGAHIDSPRLDLKQNPLYEAGTFALFDTHYYGGVKKYQWTARPLALVGVVVTKEGKTIDVNIGLDPKDPVVGIGDLLIHLSANQMGQTLANAIPGEKLDVTVGSIPLKEKDKASGKANVLKLLKDKYHFEEEDFISAEIEVVPAEKVRDYGLDRSMIAGYGHDDRCCAYPSLMALIDAKDPEYTGAVILTDKEEVGSIGATGACSLFFENIVTKLCVLAKSKMPLLDAKECLEHSKMLSSDVSAGSDPLYNDVDSPNNVATLGHGVCFNKYTGARGKSGCNDANPEFIAELRNMFDKNNVYWQTSELGKVDAGGGGTIAYILAKYNMDVIDAGIAVLNMHAPMEVISKADLYEAYLAYKVFVEAK